MEKNSENEKVMRIGKYKNNGRESVQAVWHDEITESENILLEVNQQGILWHIYFENVELFQKY